MLISWAWRSGTAGGSSPWTARLRSCFRLHRLTARWWRSWAFRLQALLGVPRPEYASGRGSPRQRPYRQLRRRRRGSHEAEERAELPDRRDAGEEESRDAGLEILIQDGIAVRHLQRLQKAAREIGNAVDRD